MNMLSRLSSMYSSETSPMMFSRRFCVGSASVLNDPPITARTRLPKRFFDSR